MNERTTFLALRAARGTDGVHALRRTLKFALRRCGLIALDAREIRASPPPGGERREHRRFRCTRCEQKEDTP
jgi:hypothetical protein